MNRADFERVLWSAERSGLARARADLDSLIDCLRAPWLDRVLRDRVTSLAARCGRTIEIEEPAPLAVGESWLLLAGLAGSGRVARMRVAPPGSDAPKLDPHRTLAAVRGLASAASRAGHLVSVDALSVAWELSGEEPPSEIEGESLGLSVCASLLSSLSKVVPRSHVAGSASVDRATGALGAVHHLAAKLSALKAQRHEVTHLVVSADQPVPDGAPFEILRCATVVEAVRHFGLDVGVLPKPTVEELRTIANDFDRRDSQLHSLPEWAALSANALEVAGLLAAREPELALRARIWAAMFASHAANNFEAAAILREIDEREIEEDHHRVMRAVVLSSATIDEDPAAAALLGEQAVIASRQLSPRRRTQWYGRALGTHGRALMHSGAYGEAEPLLRAGHEHHAAELPREAGRSACYLATCLRLDGRLDEALEFAESAQRAAEMTSHSEAARSTRPYACLELARVLLALGRAEDALPLLAEVVATGDGPRRYPRLGAHRTLAAVHRQLGRLAEADDHLRACWEVARDAACGKTARRLGAVAAVEELEHATSTGRRPFLSAEEVEARWLELFGEASKPSVLATWIY